MKTAPAQVALRLASHFNYLSILAEVFRFSKLALQSLGRDTALPDERRELKINLNNLIWRHRGYHAGMLPHIAWKPHNKKRKEKRKIHEHASVFDDF